MPELPEVERVRLTLMKRIVGQTVTDIKVRRTDVVRLERDQPKRFSSLTRSAQKVALLSGQLLTNIKRHGKQLALIGADTKLGSGKPCLCIHLGMSGSLLHRGKGQSINEPHTHVVWTLSNGNHLIFRDPRRFGGIWAFPNTEMLQQTRWAKLGPDALTIPPKELHSRLQKTSRGLKAAILDQNMIAGMGNIYVDELLFRIRLHPALPANRLDLNSVQALVRQMRLLLAKAISSGGSSLRDYVDGDGQRGGFQLDHLVYGHAGDPCTRCGSILLSDQLAGRTTVFCPTCQEMDL